MARRPPGAAPADYGPNISISLPVILIGLIIYSLLGRHLAAGQAAARENELQEKTAPADTGSGTAAGSLRHGPLLPFLVLSVLCGAIIMTPMALLPLLLADKFGATQVAVGLFLSLVALGGLITSPLAGYLSDRMGSERVMIGMVLVGVPLIILLNNISCGVFFGALLLGIGMVTTARIPIAESFLITNAPLRYRSRILGTL